MTNNQENNDNDTYVMADEPFAPPVSRVPWWALLLPLLLAGGVAIALLNNNKPETITQSETTSTPTPDTDSSSNKDLTTTPDTDSSPSNKDLTTTPDTDSSPSNKDLTLTTDPDSSSNKNLTTTPDPDSSSNKNSISTTDKDSSPANEGLKPATDSDSPSNEGSKPSPETDSSPSNKGSNELRETLLFGYKEIEVRPSDISQLESFLSKIQGKAGTLTIEGHADAIGPHDYNDNLAKKRAKQVESKLLELGLDKKYQVKVKTLGEREPAESNQTEEGRAANRRVVLTFNNKN